MKTRTLLICAVAGAVALTLGGCATRPATMAATESGGTSLTSCERVTGSRIQMAQRDGKCEPVGQAFKSYSADELASTGEMDLVEALRQLDPAFR
jgi:hypothetical protein